MTIQDPTAEPPADDEQINEDPEDYEIEIIGAQFAGTFILRDLRTGKIRRTVNGDAWGLSVEDADLEGTQWYDDYIDMMKAKAVAEIGTAAEPNREQRRASLKEAAKNGPARTRSAPRRK